MRNLLLSFIAIAAALLWVPGSMFAHHGWAAFESGSQITLKGTVVEFHFVNPHSIVEFEVKDDKGKQVWEGELSSAANLASRGWTATSLEDKEEITITGYRAKNGTHAMRVTNVVLSTGKELKLGGGKYFMHGQRPSFPERILPGPPDRNQRAMNALKIMHPNDDVGMKGQIGLPFVAN